jgi:DNA topoisomerase-1
MPVRGPTSGPARARRGADAPAATPARDAAAPTPADRAATFDGVAGSAQPPAAGGDGASAVAARADDPGARAFTADGERKWRVPPAGVSVVPNDSGRGAWIEKWRSPKTGKWIYNYTAAYMEARSDAKFLDNKRFATVVPEIRAQLAKDLKRDGTKKQQLALIVTLIDQAYFRVGNEESDDNGVYGVTTLLKKHVTLGTGGRASFDYVGKKSVQQHRVVVDKPIAKILKRLRARCASDDDRLFAYKGNVLDAGDVNAYLRKFKVTAKQFRTFHATRLMRESLLSQSGAPKDERERIVDAAFERVAALLGHTAAVCRASYVDPTVIDDYLKKGAL